MPTTFKYLLATMCLLLALTGSAQYMRAGKFARMEELKLRSGYGGQGSFRQVRPNESFGHKLTIVNNSQQAARFRLELRDNRYFKLLNGGAQSVRVPAHDSVSVNLRFLNINARVNGVYTVYVDLINLDEEADRKSYEFNIEVVDGNERAIYMQPLVENIYIQKSMKEFDVPVIMRNMLPDATLVRFEVQNQMQIPYKLTSAFQKGMYLPGQDTVVNLKFLTPVSFFEANRMNANMTVYLKNDKGDLLGMFTVSPRMLTNVGDMQPILSLYPDRNGNYVEADLSVLSNGDISENIMANKPLSASSNFGYGLNYMRYNKSGNQFLSNTYVNGQVNNLFLQVGSINDFHELSLLGRGVKARMDYGEKSDEAITGHIEGERERKLEVWAVDGEYNLLRPFSLKEGSKTMSVRYTEQEGNNGFSGSLNYFIRKEVNSNGHLHFGTWQRQLTEKQYVAVQLGGSQEIFHHAKDTSVLGYSAKLDYSYVGKRLQATFLGYRGSRNYAGNLQGGTLVNGNVTYMLSRASSIAYAIQKYAIDKPMYSDSAIYGRLLTNFLLNSVTLSHKLPKALIFAKPYMFDQMQSFSLDTSHAFRSGVRSYRLQLGANLKVGKVFVMSSIDGGALQAQLSGQNKNAVGMKINTSIQYKSLGVNLIWQQGPYFIGDLIYATGDPSKIRIGSANLTYNARLFHRLDYDANLTVQQNSNYEHTQLYFQQRMRMSIGKGFDAIGRMQVTYGGYKPLTMVTIGLRKNFDWSNDKGVAQAHFRVYYDRNNNGERDKGEKWADGVVFHFDDLNLVSGSDGSVTVKNVEKGWHKFSIMYKNAGANQSLYEQKIDLDKNQNLEIGIPPQYELKGRVVEQKDKYLGKAGSMEGIKICIRIQDREFFVYTQQDGSFRMVLRPGRYKVSIDQLRRLGVQGVEKEVKIDPENGVSEDVELIWQNNERKVEVKKIEKN